MTILNKQPLLLLTISNLHLKKQKVGVHFIDEFFKLNSLYHSRMLRPNVPFLIQSVINTCRDSVVLFVLIEI